MMKLAPYFLSLFLVSSLFGFTKDGTVYTTDGSQSDVEAAITDSTAGDTISIPAGSFTWGASADFVSLDEVGLILRGAGTGSTTITISDTSGTNSAGCIRISADDVVIKDFAIASASASADSRTPISVNGYNGWRVTNIAYTQETGHSSYFLFFSDAYGLIDNCTIVGGAGTSELVFGRGPTDSWTTADSLGGVDNVFIEDCTFTGSGYINDANSNARMVIRFNTSAYKADGHGLASNTPARGVRHMEIYNNTFTSGGFAHAVEFRGGTGYIFNNSAPNATTDTRTRPYIDLSEYGTFTSAPNFGSVFMTPDHYPIGDQVGRGQDEIIAATAIVDKQMYRIVTVGTTDYTTLGAANNNVGTQFISTGAGSGTGTVYHNTAAPVYVFGNDAEGGALYILRWNSVAAGAITQYGSTFTIEDDIIVADRDYFKEGASFNGTSGVGIGTKAQMDAITPTTEGVGFWVTDEGEWDSTNGATPDGRLYKNVSGTWTLTYTPYTYPHPLQSFSPPASSAGPSRKASPNPSSKSSLLGF